MRATIVVASAVVALAAFAGAARAEDVVTYEVEGEADAGASDPRVAALDDAFARAARRAVEDLVAGPLRTQKKQDLDREIVGRARLWISRFTVTKDVTDDDRRQLTVAVRVDRDKMRARLTELGIAITEVGTSATPDVPTGGPKARGVTILLRVGDGETTRATFGAKAEREIAGSAAIATTLKAAGYAVRRAPASGPAPKAGDLPLADAEAQALAGEAKADFALVAGVTIDPPAQVRGVPHDVALVAAHARLVDAASGKALGQGAASAAVFDSNASAPAVERALRAALADVVPAPPRAIAAPVGFRGDDTPVATPGVVLVRLPPKTPWALVLAEEKFLTHAKGVTHASLRRLSPGGWIIGVTTAEPIDKIASIARKPPATDTSATVRVAGDVVEVTLAGAAP